MLEHKPEVIYRWDLDKTYLQTDFSSARGLLRAAVEGAHRRQAIPGVRALLRGLSQAHETRVVVVSGSPDWLRGRLEKMFQLHGVRCDRLVLKLLPLPSLPLLRMSPLLPLPLPHCQPLPQPLTPIRLKLKPRPTLLPPKLRPRLKLEPRRGVLHLHLPLSLPLLLSQLLHAL